MQSIPSFQLNFRAPRAESDTAEIDLYSAIGKAADGSGTTAEAFRKFVTETTAAKIVININSTGGDAFESLAIAATLREASRAGKHVTSKVHGIAASAASLVAVSANTIEMEAAAFMMIHRALLLTLGNAPDHEASAAALRSLDDGIADTYAAATAARGKAKSREFVLAEMDRERWFTAAEALEFGLCDVVVPVNAAAPAAPPAPEALTLFRNTPAALGGRKATPSTPTALMHGGKTWGQLSNNEKHDLYFANRGKYEAMKAAAAVGRI
jgi:ATP-dependent protease ClpP protease subunit